MINMNKQGFFPYTPATQMLYGLAVAIDMLHEEGLDNVFARHHRLAEATRRAVRAWGLEILCRDAKYYSPTITAVLLPEGHDADAFRGARARDLQHLLRRELRPLCQEIFPHRPSRRRQRRLASSARSPRPKWRWALAGIPHKKGGVQAAMDYIVSAHSGGARAAAE